MLIGHSWMHGYDDPNISYKTFLSKYTEIYNLSFPLRKVKANKSSISKPLLSKCLLKSVKMKNRLYKKYLSNPTLEHEMTYKRHKNKLNHSVRIAKSLHYTKKLERVKSDTKATWRVLNEVINKKKSKTKFPSSFKVDDNTEISDPVEIANRFCRITCLNLAKKISTSPISHQTFLSGNFPNSIPGHSFQFSVRKGCRF
jgi:hypothetical protein